MDEKLRLSKLLSWVLIRESESLKYSEPKVFDMKAGSSLPTSTSTNTSRRGGPKLAEPTERITK